ncbi:MAG: glycosyltransferase [Lachnospiraceae bacterium]|nr:glycosyltransferase [Lachnospiraceae bacterium]
MRFLFIKVRGSVKDLVHSLEAMGHEVTTLEGYEFEPYSDCEEAYSALEAMVKKGGWDFLISYLFFGRVSDICNAHGLRYIAWVYDSPLMTLFDEQVKNPVNRIFVFDKREYERLKEAGVPRLYYMPMAACTDRIGLISIRPEDEERFTCDISFVGALYEDNPYDHIINELPGKYADDIKKYLGVNLCNWKSIRPWPSVDGSLASFCEDRGFLNMQYAHGLDAKTFLGVALMSRKLAQLERINVLNALARRHSVRLYTRDSGRYLEGVNLCPGVDYNTDMTRVFNLSKINLNITIPSIETGIPQRVWDIIGSGGFCMTNYQEEIEDFFTIGEDIETFKSIDELLLKTEFYLRHEDLRLGILIKGYEKVMKYHKYEDRLEKMIALSD